MAQVTKKLGRSVNKSFKKFSQTDLLFGACTIHLRTIGLNLTKQCCAQQNKNSDRSSLSQDWHYRHDKNAQFIWKYCDQVLDTSFKPSLTKNTASELVQSKVQKHDHQQSKYTPRQSMSLSTKCYFDKMSLSTKWHRRNDYRRNDYRQNDSPDL